MRIWSLAVLLVLGPAMGACQAQPAREQAINRAPAPSPTEVAAPAGSMAVVVEHFARDARDVSRFYDVPWTEARWRRQQALHDHWQERLQAIDFEALDASGRIDWLLLRNHLRARADGLALERRRLAEMQELLPFREAIVALEVERWRIEPVDPRQMAQVVDEIADMVAAVEGRVKNAPAEAESGEQEAGETLEDAEGSQGRRRQDSILPHPASRDGEQSSASRDANQPQPGAAEGDRQSAPRLAGAGSGAAQDEGEDADLHIKPAVALRAASAASALRRTLEGTIGAYIDHKPGFEWWLGSPREKAARALRDYENKLRRDIAGIKGEADDPLVGDPIGREALLADLATEMIVYTPEELIAIAERELAWRQEEMVRAAREMGFGDDWRAALDQVKTRAVDPGQQDLYVAEVSREVIAFLKENDLVTIPPLCEELWRAEMIPGHRQAMFPFAYYGGLHVGVAYPTDDMSHEDKLASMRGNNRHFTRNVVPHELIPGHHLQSFMAARHNAHRGLFGTPFLVEGWALYWEMTLWDAGWAQGPEDRMGILFWGMHRCARIIVSLRYHLGEMTAEEMIDFLIDEIGHERFGATSEVRRYIGDSYSPLYQVAYMIGGLQFRALRAEVVDTGLMTEREFHDAILTYGSIPIELIRAGLLSEGLTPDWQPSWRWDEGNDER